MPLTDVEALDAVRMYLPQWTKNHVQIDWIDRWYRGKLALSDKPRMPKSVTREYRELRDRSLTPWLKRIVNSVAQALYVEGYKRSDSPDNAASWAAWQANGLDSRQVAVHRSAIAHGLSYVTIVPGDPVPVIRGKSARRMVAFYEDIAEDDWPEYAIEVESVTATRVRISLYDEEAIYTLEADDPLGTNLAFKTAELHGAGECPVVRFANQLDLDGRAEGEVEPYIDMASRIDQDTFDRLVVQRFGSWLVRYIAGMAKPETDAEARAKRLELRVEDILIAEDVDTKFGTLPATPLDGYIKARESDIRDLATISQTPADELLGDVVNLSAEAITASRTGFTHKLEERKHGFGESWEQVLRMSALLDGDAAGAQDFEAQVVWRDMESRSLSQAADALGKLATMLGIPVELLWEKIPGFTQQDVDRAKDLREQAGPGVQKLIEELAAQGRMPTGAALGELEAERAGIAAP
jgi:hypothetical protein